ncbi:MAG TPA: FecR family protein [Spirochaetota bacterium]|nr:FecR family protein [Spirochaetota bacterium]
MIRRIQTGILITALLAFATCKKDLPEPGQGTIGALTGSVTIDSKSGIRSAATGDTVTQGDTVSTKEKSFVDIAFGENSIRVLENSSAQISEHLIDKTAGTIQTGITLANGGVFSKVMRKMVPGDSYTIKTPTSVASVRGTNFMVRSKNGAGVISCLTGKIQVRKKDDPAAPPVEISSGEGVAIDKDSDLAVKKLSDDEVKMLTEILDSMSGIQKDKGPARANRPFPTADAKH